MNEATQTSLAQTAVSGTFWLYLAKYSGKFLVFLSTVILARLLFQEDFGVAAYALVVIGFLEVAQGLGVSAALIYYRSEPARTDTAFWLSLAVGLLLFGLTWLLAPAAGLYFGDERAIAVTRILGLTFPLSAMGEVHDSLLQKELQFRRKFLPELGRSLAKGVVSIVLAGLGYGAWSLIFGQLAGVVAGVIAFWWVIPWRPSLRFDGRLARSLLAYGARLSASDVVAVLLANADYLLVGRYLGAAALGVYTLAFRIPELLVKEFSVVVGNVVFPLYARIQEDEEALRHGFLLVFRYVNLITVPMGLGLALIARPFVLTFFTERWLEAVPVMSAISLYTLLRSMVFNAGDVYKAQGRPGLLLQIKLVQAVASLPVLWWAAAVVGSLLAVAWSQVALTLVAGLVKLLIAMRLLQVSPKVMAASLWPALAGGTILTGAVLVALRLSGTFSPPLQLLVTVASGALAYGLALWWLERDVLLQLIARLSPRKLARGWSL
jgi:O-antigen/teichoic acid export membrane protein